MTISQDVGENRGRVAGVINEGGNDRPINIYNQPGGGDYPPLRPQQQQSEDDRLTRIEFYLYGDGITVPGVLRQQAEIIRQQAEILTRMSSMMFWLYTVTAALIVLVIVAILNVLLQ